MADANQAAEELARTLQDVNRDLANYQRISTSTLEQRTDAEMKAKYGIENFTRGTAKGAEAIGALASAGMAAGKAMLDGKKGAAAFNSSLDQLSSAATAAGAALALMVPGGVLIKGLVAGITAAATAYIKYTQAANDMADKLYTGYRGLAEVGAAAADGMTGVKEGAQKLGLSMDELGDYVKIVSENSREFAQFGGSVFKGRQALENMGKAMEPAQAAMLKMGLMPKDIAEGSAAYLRMQTRIGTAQGKTVDQLAEGARKYLVEQDALTKITGVSRREAEKREEAARAEEQYAGMLMKLRAKGDEAEIKRLTSMSQMMGALDQDVAKAVRSLMTGYITPEGEKLLMNAPDALKEIQAFKDKKITQEQLADRIFKGMADTGARVSAEYATMGAGADTFMSAATQLNAMNITVQGVEASLKKATAEQERQGATGKKAADELVEGQQKLIQTQISANKALTDFIFLGIGPAQRDMEKLAWASVKAAEKLRDLAGMAKEKGRAEVAGGLGVAAAGAYGGAQMGAAAGTVLGGPIGTVIGGLLGALVGGTAGYFGGSALGRKADEADANAQKPPGRAAGGPVDAGKLYKVGEQGEEFFRPNVAGEIIPQNQISGITGAANSRLEVIQRAAKEIADDTATLAKLTDVDLKKTQDASRVQDRLRKLKNELALDEVELLEEQKDQLTKMLDDMEKTMGKDAAFNMRRSITMQRAMGGGMGGGMGSGTGLQMPSAPGLPNMGGAQGLQVINQDDLKRLGLNIKAGDVQANNAKISPKLIELAKAIQSGIPGFGYFSSFNDKFHNENAPSSMHTKGLAVDFTVAQPPSIEDGKQITNWLKQMGASVAIDEYNSPTAKATGGHFHAQLPAFEDGGELASDKLGIAGEAGKPELITGPAEITPINDLMKAFGSLAGMMSQSVEKLDELVRAQKANNDISNKMLRMQQ